MTRRLLIGSFLVIALVVAACSGSSATPVPVAGTSWAMTGFEGLAGGLEGMPPTDVTLAFGTDGTVSGKGACNTFSGPYSTDGNKLKMGPLASTMMLCPGTAAAWENAYFSFLQGSPNYSVNGDTLELSGASTKVTYSKS
jgi:heat shock protein HslJ